MVSQNTLLAHLSRWFARPTEDIAVEALAHVLSSSVEAKNSLYDMLRDCGAEVGEITGVVTQQTGEEGDRPDLVCYSGNAECILIEAKFWAGLTVNQPVTYLKRLPEDGPAVLLFVAPESRFESLWPELLRRVTDAKDESIALGETTTGDGYRAASAGSSRLLLMTSWASLLNRMESRTADSGDEATKNDIRQLRGLAVRADEETLLPMRKEQLGPEIPRFMVQMNRLVDDAAIRVAEAGWIVGGNKSSDANGYRRRIQFLLLPEWTEGNWFQWFGVDIRFWGQYRETPLWVMCPGPKNWSEFREKLQRQAAIDFVDTERAIPISLPTGVEYDAVLEEVVHQFKNISELLRQG